MLKSIRSQLEIMGLVIVVILISLGLLFVLQFAVLRGGEPAKKTFTQEQIAANTVNALLITTTECQGLDVTELIQDCASFRDVRCEGQNACEFVDAAIEQVLADTLQKWGKKYNLSIYDARETYASAAVGRCVGSRDVSSYPIPSKIGGERIFVRLEVCE